MLCTAVVSVARANRGMQVRVVATEIHGHGLILLLLLIVPRGR